MNKINCTHFQWYSKTSTSH